MTNIIALAIQESHGLYEPKQCFSQKKNKITTGKEIKKVCENLKISRKKKKNALEKSNMPDPSCECIHEICE